jgi:hypothetical protein
MLSPDQVRAELGTIRQRTYHLKPEYALTFNSPDGDAR